jgi:hypothetical protein
MGTWVSEMRETGWGPLRFEFRIGDDGRIDVTGTPPTDPEGEWYRRSGPYRLEGDRLVTPALNEGQPVHVRLRDGRLHLRIDDGLEFSLNRR